MNSKIIQLLVSLLLIAAACSIIFVFVFKGGHVSHKEFWHILLFLFILIVLLLNLRPHWSLEKKHRHFFETFISRTDPAILRRILGDADSDQVDPRYRSFVKLIGGDLHLCATSNNSVEIITDGSRKYELLLHDLENAKESIHMEYYHFGADKGSRAVRDMLIKKAREGVKVKFINENVANFPIGHRYYLSMKKSGVEVIRFTSMNMRHLIRDFLTKLNYRNHRKVVVIDGKIGYTGGMNINDHYFKKWRDTHLRIEGDAVAQLQLIFLNSWVTSGGSEPEEYDSMFPKTDPQPEQRLVQIIADEPGMAFHPIQMSYVWALMHAKDYFYIQTPYFSPSEPVLEALKAAARSGVDVRIMLPKKSDTAFMGPVNKSFYKECMSSGVRFFEREGEFMHAKTFVSDDYLSCVGTANMDNRSFKLNYEDNAYIYDSELARQSKAIFMKDMETSEEVFLDDVKAWPWYQVFLQKVLHTFASVL